ncbi:MAG: hypothetical protein ACMV1B_05775 [Prevotella sp.]
MKALKFLKHMKQTDTPYNFRECKLDEAIEELEALQEENNILKHNYDVQVEYNNTAYKNYTNMVNLLEQRIEAMKPKTCEGCAYCEPFNSVCFNDKSPLCADFVNSEYGCIYWERKDNA